MTCSFMALAFASCLHSCAQLDRPVQAYLEVAPSIACYEEYSSAMAKHLLEVKLRHWDASLRELAAKAMAELVPCVPTPSIPFSIGFPHSAL